MRVVHVNIVARWKMLLNYWTAHVFGYYSGSAKQIDQRYNSICLSWHTHISRPTCWSSHNDIAAMNLLILFHSHIDNEQVSFHRVVYLQRHDIRNRVFLLRRCVPDSYVGTFPTSPYFADAFRKDGFECYPASGHQFAGWLCQPCPVGTYGNRKDRGCLKCPAGKKKIVYILQN